ncbi:unnamed protein product [Orchesella dallaii]|uniref:Uncharacterized protein n=1 Tax=Orchesella dallaii TaxID=48710 RepID=A0ABP1RUU0_9HEXA
MGSTSTDVLVNELLCATIHEILEGRTNDEIVPSFMAFYEDDEIQIARQVVYKLIDKPFAKRANAKEKDLNEIIGYLRLADFHGNDIQFATINLGRVCTVSSGIGDARQLRYETDRKEGRDAGNSRIPATPPITQLIAINNEQYERNENSHPDDDFNLVKNRRKPKPKLAVGGSAESNIKAVERTRMGLLFLTRCSPDTTTDMIEQYVKRTTYNYKLRDVELWNAKYTDSYSSIKTYFELGNEKLSNFLREVVMPDYWPAGTRDLSRIRLINRHQ